MALQLPFEPILVVPALFGLVGLVIVAFAGREFWVAIRLHRTDPTAVADVPNRSGMVEVQGVADITESTVTTPFTGTESLVCEWAVEEEHHDDDGSHWEERASGVQRVPFRVDDGTGSVLVYPAGADFRLACDADIRVDGGDPPPERIQRFIDADRSVDSTEHRSAGSQTASGDDGNTAVELAGIRIATGRDRRYVEHRLDPGELVYVYGQVRYDTSVSERAGEVNAVLEPGRLFVVADTDERGATRRIVRDALVPLFVGLVFVLGAAVFAFGLTA